VVLVLDYWLSVFQAGERTGSVVIVLMDLGSGSRSQEGFSFSSSSLSANKSVVGSLS